MKDDYKKILIEFFAWMFLLWLIWFYSGGPSHINRLDKPFLKPPSPINTNNVFGELPDLYKIPNTDTKKSLRVGTPKDYSDINLSFSSNQETDGEYIEVSVLPTSKNPINITGWKIRGIIDAEARVIGTGTYNFHQGEVNEEYDVWVYPGEKALIIPGESPVGVSFKLNKCIGYLEQFQDFSPHLPQTCPHFGLDEQTASSLDTECGSFVRSIPRCNAFVKDFPVSVSLSCSQTISKRLNYNSCVSEHKNDVDFKKREWRVYLEGGDTFGSKNGDVISIFDAEGHLIDSIFYNK